MAQSGVRHEDRANLCQFEQSQPIEVISECPPLLSSSDTSPQMSLPPPYSAIPGTVPLYTGRTAGPPPSYEDVINPEAPPPSYQSLFGQVREARKSANGLLDFLRKVIILFMGTLGCTIIIGFTVVIPSSMIFIGASYLHECPAENIPVFLLVGGIVWIFKNLMNICSKCQNSTNAINENMVHNKRRESLLNCFLFGWFIAGCVLVYRIYEPNYYDPNSENYCNKTVYLYAFWLVTSTFIVFGLFMCCLCCLTVCALFSNNDDNNDT